MDLGNPVEIVVHYLLIGGKTCLGHWDGHGQSTSVCDAHWIGPMMNHDTRLLIVMIHQTTILHGLLTLRGYLTCVKINRRL